MIKFLIIFLMIFQPISFASMYAVERPDGSLSILHYFEGSSDTLEEVVSELGYEGYAIYPITKDDLPDKADGKFWVMDGNKIKVDNVKKQAHLNKVAQEEAEIDAVLEKLKISKDELAKLKKGLKG